MKTPQKVFYVLLGLTAILVAVVGVYALEPPHDAGNNVNCDDCHLTHFGLIARGEDQETMCKTCHNPTGQASAMSDVANHLVHGGTTIVDCGSCHQIHAPDITTDPHPGGQTAVNLKLIRSDPNVYVPTALGPAIFQQNPNHFAFGPDNAPWIGVCQVCHTQTNYHTNDGSGDNNHNLGLSCTSCHSHKSGFSPAGGCTDCHNLPQNSRRQIVGAGGDFTRSSHHVNGTIVDDDCTVCHDVAAHQSGTVRLKDPDLGSSVIYSYDPNNPSGLENFCLNCHDADGALASGGLQPFSDQVTVPDIKGTAGGLWADSAHNQVSFVLNNSNPISCFGDGSTNGCHGNGHGSNLKKMLQPYDGTAGTDNVNEEEGFCFSCHRAGGVVNEAISNGWFGGVYENFGSSMEESFGMHSSHPVNDSAAAHVFDIGNGPQELECTSCHNVHHATGKHWEAVSGKTPVIFPATDNLWGDDAAEKIGNFNPVLTYLAPFLGDPGLDLSGDPLPIDGSGNSLLTDTVLPNYVDLCLECHQYPIGDLVAIDYTTRKHGTESAEPLGPAGFELASPFVDANRGQYFLDCIDCHDPHGSRNYLLLKRSVNGELVDTIIDEQASKYWRSVCDRCHISDPQARHHNDDVVYNKLGLASFDCMVCHFGMHGNIYENCVSPGCHGHNDFF